MAQKIVSYNAAKALKEAGYPQKGTPYQYVTKDYSTFKEGEVIDLFFSVHAGDNVIDIPTCLDAWLWLWREKGINIHVGFDCCVSSNKEDYVPIILMVDDPEEAIVKAIEHLVKNNLIK